jgi:hypothetical protein
MRGILEREAVVDSSGAETQKVLENRYRLVEEENYIGVRGLPDRRVSSYSSRSSGPRVERRGAIWSISNHQGIILK